MMRLLWLLLVVAGCVPVSPAPQRVAIDPRPLLQPHRGSGGQAGSLRGLAVVSIESPEGHFRARQALVAAMPDRLRAETLSMFGPPVMVVCTDGVHLQAWLPGRNSFYSGRADGTGLARLLRLKTTPRQLVGLLHHRPELPAEGWTGFQTAEGYELIHRDAGRVTRLGFDRQKRLTRLELTSDNAILMKALWSRFDDKDGFPRELLLDWPGDGRRLSLTFKSLQLDPALQPDLFSLVPPAGADLYLLNGD